jgi:serine/threonine protein kinase
MNVFIDMQVPVAIKALKAAMDAESKEEMKKEAFVMKELSHPCIVRLYGVTQSRKMNSTLMVLIICCRILDLYRMALLNASFSCSGLLLYLPEKQKQPVALVIGSSKLTFYALIITLKLLFVFFMFSFC